MVIKQYLLTTRPWRQRRDSPHKPVPGRVSRRMVGAAQAQDGISDANRYPAPSSWFSLTCCFSLLSPGFGWAIPNLSLSSWGWDFSFFSPRKSWASHKKWSPLFWMKHFSVTNVFRVTDSRILLFSSHLKMMADYSSYIYTVNQNPPSEAYWRWLWWPSYNQK